MKWWNVNSGGLLPLLNFDQVQNGWKPLLTSFFSSSAGKELQLFLMSRKEKGAVIFPNNPFRVFELTPKDAVKVVIVGQDPYYREGQAQGIAFSVSKECKLPPSLRNIFKEISSEFGTRLPRNGDLTSWARQGVLLINSVLTVEEGCPGSHAGHGWETLTDLVIAEMGQDESPKVFLLWGAHAQKKREVIGHGPHLVLEANHPSPLSAKRPPIPFMGCGHFAEANRWLVAHGVAPVNWDSVIDCESSQ